MKLACIGCWNAYIGISVWIGDKGCAIEGLGLVIGLYMVLVGIDCDRTLLRWLDCEGKPEYWWEFCRWPLWNEFDFPDVNGCCGRGAVEACVEVECMPYVC